MSSYEYDENYVRYLVEECKLSHAQVIENLKTIAGDCRGLTERTLRRFCKANLISRRSGVSDAEVVSIVARGVSEVGGYYGYRSMKGHIECNYAKGISKRRIAAALKIVDPENHEARTIGSHRQLNPRPYYAPYFGYNLHLDQNEKLVDYGVVFVAGIDGYSSYVFDIAVMPKKTNLAVYRDVFLPIISNFGLFDFVRTDYGSEFRLSLFMQQYYWLLVDPEIHPYDTYRQSKSTNNLRIERYWVENNQRVAYPMKRAFIEMKAFGIADRDIPHHLYSMSQIGMWIGRYGSMIAANAWNNHHIRNRGIPVNLIANNGAVVLNDQNLLNEREAYAAFRASGGGELAEDSSVGSDLLENDPVLCERRNAMFNELLLPQIGDASYIFGHLVNGNSKPFQMSVLCHIQLSEALYSGPI